MRIEGVLRAKGTDVMSVAPDATLHDATKLLRKHRIGALLVLDTDDKLIGIISERDIVGAISEQGADALATRVDRVMSSDVIVCSPEDTVEQLMGVMTERRFRHLPVVSDGHLVGVVSIGDVVKRRLAEVSDEANALHEYITLGR
jgi:CBS domain-containing protein